MWVDAVLQVYAWVESAWVEAETKMADEVEKLAEKRKPLRVFVFQAARLLWEKGAQEEEAADNHTQSAQAQAEEDSHMRSALARSSLRIFLVPEFASGNSAHRIGTARNLPEVEETMKRTSLWACAGYSSNQ